MYAQDVPFGECRPTEAEYVRVGRLLEQIERVAAGKCPTVSESD
jgi:hypothetical protein